MGQTLNMVLTDFEGGDTYVDVTVADAATFAEEPVEYGMTPQNGLYLVVDVTVAVTAESEGTYPVGESDFKFVAADGSVVETTFASGFEPAQQAGAKIQIS
jgi:hypothetical protein